MITEADWAEERNFGMRKGLATCPSCNKPISEKSERAEICQVCSEPKPWFYASEINQGRHLDIPPKPSWVLD